MGRSLKSRVIVGVAAVALLLSVFVGVASDVAAARGGQMATMDSITWCRNCI